MWITIMLQINRIILTTAVIFFYFEFVTCGSGNCENLQWRCDNGQCIAVEDRCDGVKNCKDGSDETVEHCIHFPCPAYAFRCAYGACIQGYYMCNNHRDCVDGSDETSFLCDLSLGPLEKDKILQGSCTKSFQMECQIGECIERERFCDGKIDCSNGKDETVELCSSSYCKKYAFRCGYGGCIAGNLRCNGKKDCADGSDEAFELCNSTEMPKKYCFIPNERKYLEIENLSGNRTIKPGERVFYGTQLKFKCPKGWHLVGAMHSVCGNDGWSNQVPHCTKYCCNYILKRGLSTTANCAYNEREVSCDGQLFPGTIAKLSCAPGYMMDEQLVSPPDELLRCDDSGEWSKPKMICKPRCGLNDHSNSIVMPWDVSIFRFLISYEFQCYGTVLSPKIVISARQCFTDIRTADIDDHELYNIVAGNYTNSYELNTNIGRPVFNVSEIYLPYPTKNIDSIVILVLVNFFDFSGSLAPICIQLRKFSTAPYSDISENILKKRRAQELGLGISDVKKSGEKSIHFLVAIWGSTLSESRSNPINLSGLDISSVIRKYVERYESIY